VSAPPPGGGLEDAEAEPGGGPAGEVGDLLAGGVHAHQVRGHRQRVVPHGQHCLGHRRPLVRGAGTGFDLVEVGGLQQLPQV
jgi:hypothetical protein